MDNKTLFNNIKTVFTLLIVAGLLSACSNSTSGDDDHEHTDPAGLELIHDGQVIYEYFDGELTEHSHLHFHAGENYPFEVHFLSEDGDHIHGEDFEDSYSLGWVIGNEDVLEIHQHEEDGRWNFHLEPIAAGETKVQFLLNHADHSHLETPAVDSEDAIEFHIEAEGEDHDHDHTEITE